MPIKDKTRTLSGLLAHITSLPSAFGIGDLGEGAHAFVDFCKRSGQSYWQILPINPTDGINGHSPYSSWSAFAGNPLLISAQCLVTDGFLKSSEIKYPHAHKDASVDFPSVIAFKNKILALAYERLPSSGQQAAFQRFCANQSDWLDDFAVFVVLKAQMQGRPWYEWPKALKNRDAKTLKTFVVKNATAIEQIKFVQFCFYKQWQALHDYATSQGVKIIGDIPIYVNADSVDVWANPKIFKLNPNGEPKYVSGCPPDYFSKTGQRWGNPVYDWSVLKRSRYAWWIQRLEHNLSLFDYLRIDHFRGFLSFWQIPAHEKFAVFGRWVAGPKDDFFKEVYKKLGNVPIIAEDLGEITEDVPALMRKFGIPGMRVLLFGFGGDLKTNPHVPANYQANSFVYTGTHDNNTILGWFRQESKEHERANIAGVLGQPYRMNQIHWQMIDALMRSKAKSTILSVADVLGLDGQGRMNTPATKEGNWRWRIKANQLTKALSGKLLRLTQKHKRV